MNIHQLIRIAPISANLRLRLRRYYLERDFDKTRRKYVKGGASAADIWQDEDWHLEFEFLEEDEARFHSRKLLGRCRELRIPVPPVFADNVLSADYQRSGMEGTIHFLSLTGENRVRLAIREEEKYRSEKSARRIPYVTAMSGLIGTITGLVALLDKWGK